jgi:uncharacterized ferritin-like protein (DUF455 family)
MELRDFAERVLFATTLEEKLRPPKIITDHEPGGVLVAPALPGRPAQLKFKPQHSGKAEFPGLHRLETEEERGRLLHFFANHELLATELMALVLLRFPDAPTAFRRGVFETLKDEQIHTRLYLRRMAECGIEFGELPVSGYFWRAVSGMANPLDYVTALSLTFEQANLDFCRHFARKFETVGDTATVKLLNQIYRDEIGHVAYGLKWFRRWKDPAESDWEAFCRQLKFPLSPSRAKGLTLNVEGRRAAGFDDSFISELNVHSQSRGRTPNVFVFNPFAEGRIAQGKSFTPVMHQQLLARDLENLPQFLCRQDDIVLVSKRPNVEFLSRTKEAGFPLPEFLEVSILNLHPNLDRNPLSQLSSGKLGELRPWAWGPDSVELLESLLDRVTGDRHDRRLFFNENIAALYSKAWSAAFLRKILLGRRQGNETLTEFRTNGQSDSDHFAFRTQYAFPTPDWLCSEKEVGIAVDNLKDALAAIASIRARGHHRIVIKEAIGLAGQNAIRLWEPELLEPQRRWIVNAVHDGRQVVVEPWLERELDFSVQLEMRPAGLTLCGYTVLLNDTRGQYLGNWAAPNYARRLPAAVTAIFSKPPDIAIQIQQLYAGIFAAMESELRRAEYFGPIGIDAFVYRKPDGKLCLKPIIEINPRYTMGRLTVELMKRVCPGSSSLFKLINRKTAHAEGFETFSDYANEMSARFPLHLEGNPTPRIREGFLCLNDPSEAQACLAIYQVSRGSAFPVGLSPAPSSPW